MTETLKYEEAIVQLERIMDRLDHEEVSLDESIELFSQGLNLVKLCNQYLVDAEKQIKILVDGELKEFSSNQGEE